MKLLSILILFTTAVAAAALGSSGDEAVLDLEETPTLRGLKINSKGKAGMAGIEAMAGVRTATSGAEVTVGESNAVTLVSSADVSGLDILGVVIVITAIAIATITALTSTNANVIIVRLRANGGTDFVSTVMMIPAVALEEDHVSIGVIPANGFRLDADPAADAVAAAVFVSNSYYCKWKNGGCRYRSLPDHYDPIPLRHVANDGSPRRRYPLGLCEGDCDSNADCAAGLKCMKRDNYEPVPGCSGSHKFKSADFCIEKDRGRRRRNECERNSDCRKDEECLPRNGRNRCILL
ncbi:hypothetical protein ACHAWC_010186 [Mediolabrus comicus]